ncbi:hypothetical protein ACKC9G_09535 [Pokkaliibacter sp. CJK22405]|uniref:hypothetical protein n=1 Tax=Pokkaliibacter sp. CJK22405 TaxID=3384615 RepID=UPI003984AA99
MTTIRDTLTTYQQFGHSDAPADAVALTKPAKSYIHVNAVSDATLDRLNLADSVAKTVDKLCEKGNQLDSVYTSKTGSAYVLDLMRSKSIRGDMLRNGMFRGNCHELMEFSEHIVAALNTERLRQGKQAYPVTIADWPDHIALLIGDPREKSSKEVAIADGWVMKPAAQTLNHSLFGSPRVLSSTQQETSAYLDKQILRFELRDIVKHTEGRFFVDRKMRKLEKQHDRELEHGSRFLWDVQHVDKNNVIQAYHSPESTTRIYDMLPSDEVAQKDADHRAAEQHYPGIFKMRVS